MPSPLRSGGLSLGGCARLDNARRRIAGQGYRQEDIGATREVTREWTLSEHLQRGPERRSTASLAVKQVNNTYRYVRITGRDQSFFAWGLDYIWMPRNLRVGIDKALGGSILMSFVF